ncbi:hypothetical protein [Bradyrhizobium elkanii]
MSELKSLPLDEAIRLRWVLRDIRARRFIVSPLDPADVQKLTQMGLRRNPGRAPRTYDQGYG